MTLVVDLALHVGYTHDGAAEQHAGLGAPALGDAVTALNEWMAGERDAGRPLSALRIVSQCVKLLRARAGGIWCPRPEALRSALPSVADTLARQAVSALDALPGRRRADVVSGALMGLTLLSNALLSTRSSLAWSLVPHWAHVDAATALNTTRTGERASGGGGGGGGSIAAGGTSDATTGGALAMPTGFRWSGDLLRRAFTAGYPAARVWAQRAADGVPASAVRAFLATLPLESLLLVHWMLVMAPRRLVRVPDGSSSTSSSSFDLLVGPPFGGDGAGSGAIEAAPIWRASAYAAHGEYGSGGAGGCGAQQAPTDTQSGAVGGAGAMPLQLSFAAAPAERWYHGTGSENAFGSCQLGLRCMTGTRHERNGGLFGAGVYLTNSRDVAQTFAQAAGYCFPCYSDPSDGSAFSGAAVLPSTPVPMTSVQVLELRVIANPANRCFLNGEPVAVRGGQPVPPASYLVVPAADDVHACRLHVFAGVRCATDEPSTFAATTGSTAHRPSGGREDRAPATAASAPAVDDPQSSTTAWAAFASALVALAIAVCWAVLWRGSTATGRRV